MITFWSAVVMALIAGYLMYGQVMKRLFGVDNSRPTPTAIFQDGVDYVPHERVTDLSLIQFLNIAGTGPICGAIAGAQWGPVAYLRIILGTIAGLAQAGSAAVVVNKISVGLLGTFEPPPLHQPISGQQGNGRGVSLPFSCCSFHSPDVPSEIDKKLLPLCCFRHLLNYNIY